jgi:NAD(P)-dependent dehydrogenase (short-subunit alcohol dehydrogenase family)
LILQEEFTVMKLQGKTAIVTGASRGIGWEVALAYAREGADVVVSARSEDSLRELVERIAELQQRAIAVTADVGDATDVEKLVNTTVDTFGKVDILCNNAG